ncbi:response regulator transcription factor [Vibrio fluvialis]
MSDVLKILVVEDDDSLFEGYSDSAQEISEIEGVFIELTNAKNVEEALFELSKCEFDAAIIDLNLDGSSPEEAAGNSVISDIYNKSRFPIKVISGNLNNLQADIREKESPFLSFHDRVVENNDVFSDFVRLYKTGITKILGRRGKLEEKLSEVFWNHLANDMDGWSRDGCDEDTLLRYTLNHLNEYLDRSTLTYNEREFYIKPPIQPQIATGDVVKNGENRYIVLSPACDIAPRGSDGDIPKINARSIILCPLINLNREAWLENGVIKEGDNSRALGSTLKKIVSNQDPKYHFLPEHGDLLASVSDFQNIESCSIAEYIGFERLATVSVSFMKEIHARFVAYIGRQGQPDLDKEMLVEKHINSIKAH